MGTNKERDNPNLGEHASYIRFGNRLAEGIIIGCSLLSAMVPANKQILPFCIYLLLWFFNRLPSRVEDIYKISHQQDPGFL
jgi:hypothetical protein